MIFFAKGRGIDWQNVVFGLFLFSLISGSSLLAVEPASLNARGSCLLGIRGHQQSNDYTCGPSAILSLLKYYNMEGSELEMAKEMKTIPGSGTHPVIMTEWLNNHGFKAEWRENANGDGSRLEMLRGYLAKGIPILVEWIDWGGHWVVVAGYDTKGTESTSDDVIILADPYDRIDRVNDGLTTFNAERFDSMWFDANCFDRKMWGVHIIAQPQKINQRKSSLIK